MAAVIEGRGTPAKLRERSEPVHRHERNRRLFLRIGAVLALLGIIAALLYTAGYRLNRTASYPLGIYKLTGAPTRIGDLALFCPPSDPAIRLARQRGYIPFGTCAGGTAPLIKRLVARAGDRVEIGAHVSVNGARLASSAVLAADGQGRPLPRAGGGVLSEGQVWLMSDYAARSFDSRYFGAVPEGALIGAILPVWTWGAR